MNPATTAKRRWEKTKLLTLSGSHQIHHSNVSNFGQFLNAGDLLVINRSSTLPSSFQGEIKRTKQKVEIRLAAFRGPSSNNLENWFAISFGFGSWKTPTEKRDLPPEIIVGDQIDLGFDLKIVVMQVTKKRLLTIRFESTNLPRMLYKYGKPIQYSYLEEDLEVWDQQSIFSGPPISVEPPSAGFPFNWQMVLELKNKGVQIAPLLHGAGISSSGDLELDESLPLEEWYEIPTSTAEKVNYAKQNGSKVIALGTTVLRALESAAQNDRLVSGSAHTKLYFKEGYSYKIVDSLISGMHEKGTSHRDIFHSLFSKKTIEKGYREAEELGYLSHEFGDLTFIRDIKKIPLRSF